MSRLWKRYIKLKRPVGEGGAKFEGQYVVDADTRTFNWPMFFALMDRTGVPVPSIADALEESRSASPRPSKRKRPKEGYMTFSDSDVEEQILYTGNEDGIPLSDADADADAEAYIGDAVEDDVDEADLSDDDSSSVEEDEEEVDPEQSHIDNLVSLTGDASQFFDTERWFRTLLWTLQMYIDGYCGDYTFQYAKPYGPSSAAILQYIRDHDGDPFMLHAPVSSAPALLPHQAAMAMLPRRATHLLPTPVQKIFEDTAVVKKIFLGNERVNVAEMVKAINSIPESAFSPSELRLTRHGSVLLLRIPRRNDRVLGMNQKVWTPGTRYPAVAPVPVIFRKIVYPTSSPPGYKWPKGSFSNMMNLPYHKAKGMQLKVSTTAAPSKKVTPQQAPGQQKPPTGTTDTVEGENGGRVARRPGKAPVKRGKARTRRTSAPQSLGQAEDA